MYIWDKWEMDVVLYILSLYSICFVNSETKWKLSCVSFSLRQVECLVGSVYFDVKFFLPFFFFHVKYLFHLSTLSTISLFISIASKQHQLLKIFERFSLEKAVNDFSGNLFLELWSPLGIHCCISHSLWNLMLYLPIILSPPHWFLAILSFWKSSTLTISAWNHNQWLIYIYYVKNLTEVFMDQVHSQSESMEKIGEKTKSVLKLLKKIVLFILSIDISS